MRDRNRALLAWYDTSRRSLPWRTAQPEPWAVLVSEVMAQQTQLTRVIPAFEAFMERFPTPGLLAEAELAEVLELWGGLGYQRRAINLRRTATIVAERGWPTDVAGLRSLPGVGPYTAAAIACFAFGLAVPAVDTNLRRVLSRWSGEPLDGVALDEQAELLLDRKRPSAWNQAIMDLGATICRPRSPSCTECPVQAWCTDPAAYVPPPRQSRYEGSVRQARAAILKALAAEGPIPVDLLRARIDLEPVETALDALRREGIIAIDTEDKVSIQG